MNTADYIMPDLSLTDITFTLEMKSFKLFIRDTFYSKLLSTNVTNTVRAIARLSILTHTHSIHKVLYSTQNVRHISR